MILHHACSTATSVDPTAFFSGAKTGEPSWPGRSGPNVFGAAAAEDPDNRGALLRASWTWNMPGVASSARNIDARGALRGSFEHSARHLRPVRAFRKAVGRRQTADPRGWTFSICRVCSVTPSRRFRGCGPGRAVFGVRGGAFRFRDDTASPEVARYHQAFRDGCLYALLLDAWTVADASLHAVLLKALSPGGAVYRFRRPMRGERYCPPDAGRGFVYFPLLLQLAIDRRATHAQASRFRVGCSFSTPASGYFAIRFRSNGGTRKPYLTSGSSRYSAPALSAFCLPLSGHLQNDLCLSAMNRINSVNI